MPNAMCAAPKGFTYDDARAKYKEMQKKYPGLTPAAWRKAAAQEMGIDYPTYLKLWKTKPAVASVPESIPTLQAVLNDVTMSVKKAPKYTTEKALQQVKAEAAIFEKGLSTIDEAVKYIDDIVANAEVNAQLATLAKDLKGAIIKGHSVTDTLKAASGIADDAAKAAIQTSHGPLTHDLAQSVYKKMKLDMPGATPATLRHAAADYLGVPYDDYLKAWKKTTTAAQKAATTPASKLPPIKEPPLSPSSTGKYAKKAPDATDVKEELFRLYGPGAQKNYIALNDIEAGVWTTQLPQSLLKSELAKKNVVKALHDLGLQVKHVATNAQGTWTIKITSPSARKAAEDALKAATKTGGVTVNHAGQMIWQEKYANDWTTAWWSKISKAQQDAVRMYTGPWYQQMNGYLRGSAHMGSVSVRSMINDLSGAMRVIKHDVTVFRGTQISIEQFNKGALWSDEGFLSTTIDPNRAWTGVKFEIVCPKGTRGAYVGLRSSHSSEAEFIIDKNTKFRVLEVDRINKRVKLVAIPRS